jgi:hypothetical protein
MTLREAAWRNPASAEAGFLSAALAQDSSPLEKVVLGGRSTILE